MVGITRISTVFFFILVYDINRGVTRGEEPLFTTKRFNLKVLQFFHCVTPPIKISRSAPWPYTKSTSLPRRTTAMTFQNAGPKLSIPFSDPSVSDLQHWSTLSSKFTQLHCSKHTILQYSLVIQ